MLAQNQSFRWFSSAFIVQNNSLTLLCEKRLVSSTNKIASNNGVEWQRSFINIKNNRGPSIEPGGTPQITFLNSVLLEFS